MWVQVNRRVNYPIKRVLVQMEERDIIDLSDVTTQFCVSHILIHTSAVGMNRFIMSWNAHCISGKNLKNHSTIISSFICLSQ